jgi:hypothetical protein
LVLVCVPFRYNIINRKRKLPPEQQGRRRDLSAVPGMRANDKYRRLALPRVRRLDIQYPKTAAMGGSDRCPFPYRDDRTRPGHRRFVVRHFEHGNFWSVAASNNLASCAEAPAHITRQINSKTNRSRADYIRHMLNQPALLAFSSICILCTTLILLWITIRMSRAVTALLEMRRANLTGPPFQCPGGEK